jgi:carboxyl-terminal processing protease
VESILSDYSKTYNVDTGDLSQAAIEGMRELLDDPYTTYLDSEAYQSSLNDLAGEFEGIGATVSTNDEGQIEIIAPMPDSPAAEAGIQPGDIILAVNGQSTEGMSLYETILIIRGPEGTAVNLTDCTRADAAVR